MSAPQNIHNNPKNSAVRRGLNILGLSSRAKTLPSLSVFPAMTHAGHAETSPTNTTATDIDLDVSYESFSSTNEEIEESDVGIESEGETGVKDLTGRETRLTGEGLLPGTRAWYEFDLAVVVALVSPVGNWLTGGDHIKNLLLIILLVFYLHQIIEVPWTLYQKSRPRRPPPTVSPTSPQDLYQHLASTELKRIEILLLLLTILSPMIGAIVLRTATAHVLGQQAVSWFSTGLFVLATGMRPWAHLIERLGQRIGDLHNVVHYGIEPGVEQAKEKQREDARRKDRKKMRAMENRMKEFEQLITDTQERMIISTEEVCASVDNAVELLAEGTRKQELKWEKYIARVDALETAILSRRASASYDLQPRSPSQHHKKKSSRKQPQNLSLSANPLLAYLLPEWFTRLLPDVVFLPFVHRNSVSSQQSKLAPIPEESDFVGPDSKTLPYLAQPSYVASSLVYRAGGVLMMPLRAAVRMVLGNY